MNVVLKANGIIEYKDFKKRAFDIRKNINIVKINVLIWCLRFLKHLLAEPF